ncbi:hypothetical protein L6452_03115 [Arctium lappa]|uniref:Uncharacterized protein n=1 Tax=Arctium lappa TaxID=4217 RepID=A0ACB9FLX5_ARCLA|nr:hypothetical protein L6452_03115 [Arctium lappa]
MALTTQMHIQIPTWDVRKIGLQKQGKWRQTRGRFNKRRLVVRGKHLLDLRYVGVMAVKGFKPEKVKVKEGGLAGEHEGGEESGVALGRRVANWPLFFTFH